MNRHATLDELARLGVDDVRPRRAAKINSHLATCPKCTELSNQLSSVPAMLSSVQFPEMPASLSTRIDGILAAEAAQRVAAEPATEAGRRDLPVRAARRQGRPARERYRTNRSVWRLPVPATRVLATAGAIIVVGIGGYEIASHAGGAVISSSSGVDASGHAAEQPFVSTSQVSLGPSVTYSQDGSSRTIETVTADTDFTSSKLAQQAEAAITAASHNGMLAPAKSSIYGPSLSASTAAGSGALGNSTATSGFSHLSGCMTRVIPRGQVVTLVEQAKFEGKPATIIVTVPASASGSAHPKGAEIWALGEACSGNNSDVLDHVKVARL
jgi:hypothetical protein